MPVDKVRNTALGMHVADEGLVKESCLCPNQEWMIALRALTGWALTGTLSI